MPVYEYVCKSCGHHLEVSQSFTDEPLTTCPVCEGQLRKVFSSVGIMFKGSGFYRTDSRVPSGKAKDGAAGEKQSGEKAGDAAAAGAAAEKSGTAEKSEKKSEKSEKSEKKADTSPSGPKAAKTGDVAKSA